VKEINDFISCCGLDCSKCGAYLAAKADDDNKRAEVAKKWSAMYGGIVKPEDINCSGCRPKGPKFAHCNVCEIRKCCMEKGLDNCAGCDMYVCNKLEDFFKMAPDARETLDKLRLK
jgi:hypothetical protein